MRHRLVRYVKRATVVIVLALLFCLFALNGFVNGAFGSKDADTAPVSHEKVPQSVRAGGPLIVRDLGNSTKPLPMPPHTVVISFNGGPDPAMTTGVLSVLAANNVHATFFLTGANIAAHPDLVRRIRRSGNEIGLEGFTNANFVTQSARRTNIELSESQLALAGATGITTALLRPPHTSYVSALDDNTWPVVERMAAMGYVVTLSSLDGSDWKAPTVDAMVQRSIPSSNSGGIVSMSNQGADATTVAALAKAIPALKQRNYTFATVGDVLGQPTANSASRSERMRGQVVIAAVYLSHVINKALTVFLFLTGILVTARMLVMLIVAFRHARSRRSIDWSWGPPVTQPVTVIVPAYNEGPCIADTIHSLLANNYPMEIIVVDDGSTDDTAEIAESIGARNVRVIRKPNGGKASALNVGISLASHDLIVMMDGDTVFEPDAVQYLVQPFANATVGAVAGNAKVGNRTGILGRWQHIEYVIGFNIDRRLYDRWQCMPTIAGAIGAYRRSVLLEVGGLSNATLAEDTDLTMSICRSGWRVVYEDRACAQTEVPLDIRSLWRQRYRWSYGTMQAMWKHRRAIIETGASGRLGRRGVFNLALFQLLLPFASPAVDVFLIYGVIFLNPAHTVIVWLGMLGMQTITGVCAFKLGRERYRSLWVLPLQQFVYRQLMYFVVLQSLASAAGGVRLGWQKLARTGGLGAILESQLNEAPAEVA